MASGVIEQFLRGTCRDWRGSPWWFRLVTLVILIGWVVAMLVAELAERT